MDNPMSNTVRLELTAEEAMWMWRVLDVMNDVTRAVDRPGTLDLGIGWYARHVRDMLSAQGVTGDYPAQELSRANDL